MRFPVIIFLIVNAFSIPVIGEFYEFFGFSGVFASVGSAVLFMVLELLVITAAVCILVYGCR